MKFLKGCLKLVGFIPFLLLVILLLCLWLPITGIFMMMDLCFDLPSTYIIASFLDRLHPFDLFLWYSDL